MWNSTPKIDVKTLGVSPGHQRHVNTHWDANNEEPHVSEKHVKTGQKNPTCQLHHIRRRQIAAIHKLDRPPPGGNWPVWNLKPNRCSRLVGFHLLRQFIIHHKWKEHTTSTRLFFFALTSAGPDLNPYKINYFLNFNLFFPVLVKPTPLLGILCWKAKNPKTWPQAHHRWRALSARHGPGGVTEGGCTLCNKGIQTWSSSLHDYLNSQQRNQCHLTIIKHYLASKKEILVRHLAATNNNFRRHLAAIKWIIRRHLAAKVAALVHHLA